MYLFIREQFSKEPCGLIVTSNYAKTDMGLSSNAKILCDDVGAQDTTLVFIEGFLINSYRALLGIATVVPSFYVCTCNIGSQSRGRLTANPSG
jgi:hypothetical protein